MEILTIGIFLSVINFLVLVYILNNLNLKSNENYFIQKVDEHINKYLKKEKIDYEITRLIQIELSNLEKRIEYEKGIVINNIIHAKLRERLEILAKELLEKYTEDHFEKALKDQIIEGMKNNLVNQLTYRKGYY